MGAAGETGAADTEAAAEGIWVADTVGARRGSAVKWLEPSVSIRRGTT
ncbi:hypothetical protein U5640_18445 [Streptomyces sp. SS7]